MPVLVRRWLLPARLPPVVPWWRIPAPTRRADASLVAPTADTSASASPAAGVTWAIWSRVIGPRRYDIAQRVVNTSGVSLPARRSTNSRLASPEIVASIAATSTDPAALDIPSSRRALSRSVCRRPIIQVPAFDIAL